MNKEQAETLIKMVDDYMFIQTGTIIISTILSVLILLWVGWEIFRFYKVRKYRKEWLRTLTDEQLKAIKDEKKYNV